MQNIRDLVSNRQVTNLITNHTYSNLVLRVPGVASFGFPLDEMLKATADPAYHSVIEGAAPVGSTLKISKSFQTSTSPVWQDDFGTVIGDPIQFPDTLSSELKVTAPTFRWHVNPSTRPVVAGRDGRDPTGPPQDPITLANPPGIPAENVSYPAQPYESIPFTVQGPADGVDNGWFTVHIEWSNPNTGWDLYIVNAAGNVVAQSAAFGDTTEDATMFEPPPGEYTAHVVNYDQVQSPPDDWFNGNVTFRSPTPRVETGVKESWTLTCIGSDGKLKATRQVTVDRGQSVQVGNACTRTR